MRAETEEEESGSRDELIISAVPMNASKGSHYFAC